MNFKVIFLLVTTSFTFNVTAKEKHYGTAIISEITSIYDGDTFRANLKGYPAIIGEHMSIRINGIDTPELRGKCEVEKQLARKAKQFTVEHLRAAKNITLKNIKRGKYFRLIADVYVGGVNLGEQLIKQGHAVKYTGKTKRSWC
jgi:micrococcal nuclease